jgi:hypothetical protein
MFSTDTLFVLRIFTCYNLYIAFGGDVVRIQIGHCLPPHPDTARPLFLTMPPGLGKAIGDPGNDDYVAQVLADEARSSSLKYSSLGTEAYMPRRCG